MKKLSLVITFWAQVAVFVFIICQMTIPAVRDLFMGSILFLAPFAVFFLLGIALIFFTLKEKVTGKLKRFLLLTGAAAGGFLISVVLHNLFYALAIVTGHIIALSYLAAALEIAFFFIAIFVCPIGFLIGMIGTAVLLIKKRK